MDFNLDSSTKIILKVFGVLLALAFLWFIRDIVVIVLLSLVLASAMEPVVEYLNKHKIPRSVSVLSAYVVVIGFASLIVSLMLPVVIEQAQILKDNLPRLALEIETKYPLVSSLTDGGDLTIMAQKLIASSTGGQTVLDRTLGLFNGLFAILTVLVLSFYLVAADRGMKKFVSDIVPPKYHTIIVTIIDKIQRKMGLWVVGQVILSLFIFSVTYIGLKILGMPYALLLAILAGLFEVIPYVGPFLSAVPAVFFALTQSPALVVGVIILYVVIQKTEGYVLVPKIMEKTVGTSPLVVLLALLIGFKLAGFLGLLLAVPLAGAITVVIHEFYHQKTIQPDV